MRDASQRKTLTRPVCSRCGRLVSLAVALGRFCSTESWLPFAPLPRVSRHRAPESALVTPGRPLHTTRHRQYTNWQRRERQLLPAPLPAQAGVARQASVGAGVDDENEGRQLQPLPQTESGVHDEDAQQWQRGEASSAVSWEESFAALRNDAADPWTAADGSTSTEGKSARDAEIDRGRDLRMKQSGLEDLQSSREARTMMRAAEDTATDSTESERVRPAMASSSSDAGSGGDGGRGSDDQSKIAAPIGSAQSFDSVDETVLESDRTTSAGERRVGESGSEESSQGMLAEAAELMASRGESDPESADRAYRLLDAVTTSAAAGSDVPSPPVMARLKATALLSWVRSSTDGNGLVIGDDGKLVTSDTPERQRLWTEYAPRVLQLLEEVGIEPSMDAELQQLYAEAIMYSVASQGIVEAFVTGQALKFTSAVGVLVKKFPRQEDGVAYIFQGSYYLAAPWPIRSSKKARQNYEKAVEINGRSRRNVYYAGIGRLACGDLRGAAEMFERSASDEECESCSATERDIATVLRTQSLEGLKACR